MTNKFRISAIALSLGFQFGCQDGLDDPSSLPALDEAYFRCHVQPVLVKSCGAFACHGDGRRYFRVFGRNRLRAQGAERERHSLLTSDAFQYNFDSARAIVDREAPPASPLLLKPLEQRAGGSYHRGADIFGMGNVFLSREERDFKTLDAWVHGAKEDPACKEPGVNQ